MNMEFPKVISTGKIQLSNDIEITVCILDDGRRVIPKEDMLKAMRFLGFNDAEINRILTIE